MMERLRDEWLAVCLSRELVSRPLGVTVLETPVVLFREGGRAVALPDRCTHRNAPLSAGKVRGELLVCPYHGWSFDGQGQCRRIPGLCSSTPPASAHLAPYPTLEVDGLVFVAVGDQPQRLPWSRPFEDRFLWAVELEGSLLNVVENFLDATHTHFVHAGLIRGEGPRQRARVEVVAQGDRVEASYFDEQRPAGLVSRLFEGRRHSSHGRFILPSVAEVEFRSPERAELVVTAYVTPVHSSLQRAYVAVSTPRGMLPGWLKRLLLMPFLRAALAQDRAIVRLQQRNIERFGGERFVSTELDVIRSQVLQLLTRGPLQQPLRRQIVIEL